MSETIEEVYTSIFLDEEQDPPLDCMTLKFDYSSRDTWETLTFDAVWAIISLTLMDSKCQFAACIEEQGNCHSGPRCSSRRVRRGAHDSARFLEWSFGPTSDRP